MDHPETGSRPTVAAPGPQSGPALGPAAHELARRIAGRQQLELRTILRHFRAIAKNLSADGLENVATEGFRDEDLDISVVRHRVIRRLNRTTPRYTHCTAGVSALEISPDGRYARCLRFADARKFTGHLLEPGEIKRLHVDTDDMSCTFRCPEVMCFSPNVLRATDLHGLRSAIAEHGIRGLYKRRGPAPNPEVFVRWKITDICNYSCPYCTNEDASGSVGRELNPAELLRVAGKIVQGLDRISLRLTGGEPSTHRGYVELMRFLHGRLDRFTDIEVRTNLSFQHKYKEILQWDWQGKLNLNVACHIQDKNFMPWRFVDILRTSPRARYLLKFVATPGNRHHVAFFRDYFLRHGIPAERIHVTEEIGRLEGQPDDADDVPIARKAIESRVARVGGTLDGEAGSVG